MFPDAPLESEFEDPPLGSISYGVGPEMKWGRRRRWARVQDGPPVGKEPGPGYRLNPPGGTATRERKRGRHPSAQSSEVRRFGCGARRKIGVGGERVKGWLFLSVHTFASKIPAPFEFFLFSPTPTPSLVHGGGGGGGGGSYIAASKGRRGPSWPLDMEVGIIKRCSLHPSCTVGPCD